MFVRYPNSAGANDGAIGTSVLTVAACTQQCFAMVTCAGFDWRLNPSSRVLNCLLYNNSIGATHFTTDFDNYSRMRCVSQDLLLSLTSLYNIIQI